MEDSPYALKCTYFDPTSHGFIDEKLLKELNLKIQKIKESFQEIIDSTVANMYEMTEKMAFMNRLSPDAYGIANLDVE
jgi:hypothetical protein